MDRPSICFVSLNNYCQLSGDPTVRHIGGAEVQQVLIARALVARGYRVCFVTFDHGQQDGEVIDGIKVFKAYHPDSGLPGLRFVHPRITRIWSAMKRADADIYYQRTSDSLTGVVAAFCRWHRRRFVFGAASEADVDENLPHCETRRERILYRFGLYRADRVVTQTITQQMMLRCHFGIDSVLIRNAIAAPAVDEALRMPANSRMPAVLWSGRFARDKRPELLLDIAARCPEITIHVLGDGPKSEFVREIWRRAAGLPNLHMHGSLPRAEALRYYLKVCALLCTSRREGFPNTFLEAWCRGLPVITTFDPDGVVAGHYLGLYANDAESLARAVRSICFDTALRSRLGRSAYEYFLSHHTIEAAVDAYDRLLCTLCLRTRD